MTVYLDHAATTPMRRSAADAWWEARGLLNPGSQHAPGRAAAARLAEAREIIAEALDADPVEVIITGSGTEADNIAVDGILAARRGTGRHVLHSPLEHPGVAEPLRRAAARGEAEPEELPLDDSGHVDAAASAGLLRADTALITCMAANNETGAVQPVQELADAAAANGTPMHVDAVQAVGRIPVPFHRWGAATVAASAHKFGGPRGTGILLVRRDAQLDSPPLLGGGQERGLRPGTVDVASAWATAVALREAEAEREAEYQRLAGLRDRLLAGLRSVVPDLAVHTRAPALPGHLHVSVPGAEGDSLTMLLDAAGVAISTGSACHSGVNRASDTLLAMGVPEGIARGALRFSLGHTTTAEDIDRMLTLLPEVVERARAAGMA